MRNFPRNPPIISKISPKSVFFPPKFLTSPGNPLRKKISFLRFSPALSLEYTPMLADKLSDIYLVICCHNLARTRKLIREYQPLICLFWGPQGVGEKEIQRGILILLQYYILCIILNILIYAYRYQVIHIDHLILVDSGEICLNYIRITELVGLKI